MKNLEQYQPQPTLPESTGNPYLDAVQASEQRIAEARTEIRTDISGVTREHSDEVDLEAERYAAAVNHGRAKGWEEGQSGAPMTAEEVREMLSRSPQLRERLDDMKARYEASRQNSEEEPVLSAEAMREIMHLPEEEARGQLDGINRRSVELLESNPANNTGVGDKEFAQLRFKASVYAMRLEDLQQDKPGADFDQHDKNLDAILEESKLWERIAQGEDITFQESQAVRQHALDLRQAYSEQPANSSETEEDSLKAELLNQIPEDPEERQEFSEREFRQFDPAKKELYKAYLTKEIRAWARKVPEGARYPDTIRTFLGMSDNAGLLYLGYSIISQNPNVKSLSAKEMAGVSFSKICKEYLSFDVYEDMPDYAEKFNVEVGSGLD